MVIEIGNEKVLTYSNSPFYSMHLSVTYFSVTISD